MKVRLSSGKCKGKIVHLSSVHRATDTRILHKECRSLVEAGYEVTLIARADQDTCEHGVRIRALPVRVSNRLVRMTLSVWDVFVMARSERADVYHFHDPELIPVAIILKLFGSRVVYDVHENVPKLIRSKFWIPALLRPAVARLVGAIERIGSRFMDGVVAATPGIAERFPGARTILVQNYPHLGEFESDANTPYKERLPSVTYVGSLTEERGAKEMVEAIGLVGDEYSAVLSLAGDYAPKELRGRLASVAGWRNVRDLGWLSRPDVADLLNKSRVGLLVLHPVPNHLDSYPNKLFEYMAASIPVVTSRFPFWKQFVEVPRTGIMVDETDPHSIAEAIRWLLTHPDEAEEMGRRGRRAVENEFNWGREATKLVNVYNDSILG